MTNANEHPHVRIAHALTERLIAGDVEGVAAIYADDVVVFRNFDGRELGKKQVVKVVSFLASAVKDLRYEDVRVEPTERGFVQRHVLRGRSLGGAEVTAYACLIVGVRDGKIVRIDEYVDSAQLAPLMGG